ncbi:DegT/DnrJ/EryC1/StrS family aminotransferase [Actinophytocola gossypii]|uniref:DegT/DnrJ/EryC1/StrS family aminotransferase n=1 Tax=Actinophytocola gossypii TaxID=2812003 RepID=A0ABT2J5F8_9PSEU|nr:DegT/DnrJ/EryC1/StrS family aminotransferase [Actinophytocola gossypii]MCT2583103.1 DegT/DnrJ/EryC1/StrS family aminotransferase [Actinophytocola gossypii]
MTGIRFPGVAEAAGRTLGEEEVAALRRVIDSGMLSGVWGTEVPALEAAMAELHGVAHAVAASSGTAAIHLALAGLGLDPGDEVVTSPISDFGTVAPILACNAVPVFADVDPLTGNLDPAAVAAAIGPRTRAIVVVHLFGAAAPTAELRAVADRHGLALVEDCAQAWLTRTADDRLAGTTGVAGCFSLQQWKHITCGDGGLVVTDDAALARRMRLFADKGWPRDTGRHHVSFGVNYRMTELQAAVARAQLVKLPGVLAARRRLAARLVAAVADVPGITVPGDVDRHAWWLFPFVVDPETGPDNQAWAARLVAAGIPARAGYLAEGLHCALALTTAPVYGSSRYPLTSPPADAVPGYGPGRCPRAERMIERTLVVVDWNERYTDEHVDAIASAFRSAIRGTGRPT